MNPTVITQWVQLCIALSTAGVGIYVFYRRRLKKRVDAVRKFLRGLPKTCADVQTLMDHMKDVRHELHPNGGSSLRDSIDRIERKLTRNERLQECLMGFASFAIYMADAHGACTFVNRTLVRWTGVPSEDLLGEGWINVVHPEDVDQVQYDWESAVDDGRAFDSRFRITGANEEVVHIHSRAYPIGPGQGFIGVATREHTDVEDKEIRAILDGVLSRVDTLDASMRSATESICRLTINRARAAGAGS